jgi:hypothetical protein
VCIYFFKLSPDFEECIHKDNRDSVHEIELAGAIGPMTEVKLQKGPIV